MTRSTFDLTRRTFGQMLGAAAVLTPGIAGAVSATPRDETILTLNSVPLSWPQYHKLSSFDATPKVGQSVTLRREARAPFDDEAVAVFSEAGERLGYISRQHNAALSWAMDRGEAPEARITRINGPVVRGQGISGWGAFHVDVRIARRATV